MKLAGRLVLGAVALLVFGLTVVTWTARTSLRESLEVELRASLEEEARMVQAALPEDPQAWSRLVGRWAATRGHAVTLLDRDGRALADNRIAPGMLGTVGPMADLPEVRAAREGRVGSDRRVEEGEPVRLFVAVPGEPIVRVASDLTVAESALASAQRAVFLAAVLALLIGALAAYVAGLTITRPLGRLALAARDIPGGPPLRLSRTGIPEVDQLNQALRSVQQELGARFDQLRHGRAESAALVDAMVESVLASDDRGRIVTANPAARRLLGYAPEAALPELRTLFRARGAREVVDATLAGEAVLDREVDLGGTVVLVNSRPLPAGGAVLVMHDVTQLRRLEAVRRDFVANVSHELKTPLTSISGYAETLLADDADPATRRQFLGTILSNAQRMHRLVDDQLDLARIESDRWHPEPVAVEVATAAREAWARCATAAAVPRYEVTPGAGAEAVHADPEAVAQILGNLLDNALRHTPADGTITCWSATEAGGTVLAVTDTGSGMASEHLPRIFERFYRVDPARSRAAGGTGLGLAIVKHLTEAHGGRVSAESELGRGTTIRCWFPAAA